jgi:transcriptional regulator with XRE-family HTH domain
MTGKYDPARHPDTIGALARRGLTDEQIAKEIRISKKTLSAWKKDHVAVGEALKEGKVIADGQVEKALYRRACGYTYTEKKITEYPDGSQRVETTRKEVVPDTTAMIFWLKNRAPDTWRDVQRQEVTGAEGGPLQVRMMTDEELLVAAKKAMGQVKR